MALIGISLEGEKEIADKLKKLPPAVQDAGVEASNEYIVNNLRRYPPYKKIRRKDAYGVTFFTKKQRGYFFYALRMGIIRVPYRRTQGYSKAWKTVGTGYRQIVANETPYAEHLQGDRQARLSGKIGWEKLSAWLKSRMSRVLEKFDGAVKKAIKKVGLS